MDFFVSFNLKLPFNCIQVAPTYQMKHPINQSNFMANNIILSHHHGHQQRKGVLLIQQHQGHVDELSLNLAYSKSLCSSPSNRPISL